MLNQVPPQTGESSFKKPPTQQWSFHLSHIFPLFGDMLCGIPMAKDCDSKAMCQEHVGIAIG